jgi:hypothetical protein
MSKQKRFEPPSGFIVAVHQNIFGVRCLAEELGTTPYVVAKALEESGFCLTADIMDLSADTAKVILLQEKNGTDLKVVRNESTNDNNASDGGDTTKGVI